MKISGVAGGGHAFLKKGDPIHYSPEKKIEVMAMEAISTSTHLGNELVMIPISASIIGSASSFGANQDSIEKNPVRSYQGTAKVIYRPYNPKSDRIFPEKELVVKLKITDIKDKNGFPDIRIDSFEIVTRK